MVININYVYIIDREISFYICKESYDRMSVGLLKF